MIITILRTPSLHTPSYVLLCTLAISDLGMGVVGQPLFTALRIFEMKGQHQVYCKLAAVYFSTASFLLWLSCFTIVAISVDRFLAVYLCQRYRGIITVNRVILSVIFTFLIAVSITFTYIIDMKVYFGLINAAIPVCLVLTALNYFKINRILRRHQALINSQGLRQNVSTDFPRATSAFNFVRYEKSLRTVLYVYCVFLMCYLPYWSFSVVIMFLGRTSAVHAAYIITTTIVLANSSLNPVLYYWRIAELRQAMKKLYRK